MVCLAPASSLLWWGSPWLWSRSERQSRHLLDGSSQPSRVAAASATSPSRPTRRLRRRDQLPELRLSDEGHSVPFGRQTSDLHQLEPAALAGDLLRVGPATHQDVGRRSRACLHDRARPGGRSDRFTSRPVEEPGERHATSLEAPDPAGRKLLWTLPQRGNQLAGRLVALLPRAEAAMNDLLQVIAARESSDVAAPHGAMDVAPEQHRNQLAHLINVIALLPLAHLPPGDLGRCSQRVECIGGHAATTHLVSRYSEITQFQPLVLAHEDVEWRQVSVQGLAAMQDVQRLQYGGDLVADKSLRLPSLHIEPRTEVAMLGVLHHQTVARARCLGHHESVEHPERSRLAVEQLSEIGFAQPAGDAVADLDADLRRERSSWGRRRKIDLAEPSFADQTVQAVSATCFTAVDGRKRRA